MMAQRCSIFYITTLFLFIKTSFSLAWSQSVEKNDAILKHILYNNFQLAEDEVNSLPPTKEKKVFEWHIKSVLNDITDSIESEIIEEESNLNKVLKLLKNAKIIQRNYGEKDSLIFKNLYRAYSLSKEYKSNLLHLYVLYDMVDYLYVRNEDLNLISPYLEEIKDYAISNQDIAFYEYYTNILNSQHNGKDTSSELKAAFKLIENSNNFLLKANILQMIGVFESYFNSNQEEALNYWKLAAQNFEKVYGITKENNLFGIYNNIAVVYSRLDMPKKAFEYYAKAINYRPVNKPLETSYLYQGLADLHKKENNIDSSFYYLEEEKKALKVYYDNTLETPDIVYHPRRVKVTIAGRTKVTHPRRVKVDHL